MTMRLIKILLVISVLTFLMNACVRKEDKDMLSHPIHLTGEIDPYLGIPIAYTDMQIEDVLNLLDKKYTRYIDTTNEDELITIKFDTTFSNYFIFDNATISPSEAQDTKNKTIIHSDTTVIEGEQTFDMLEHLEILEDFSITQALLNWKATVGIETSADVEDLINEYGVEIYAKNIQISAINTDNPTSIYDVTINGNDSIMIDRVINGNSLEVDILDNVDVGMILKVRPNKIRYKANIYVNIPNTAFAVDIMEVLGDTLSIKSMTVDSKINTRFPINIKIDNYEQTIDTIPLNVGGNIDTLMQQLDSIEYLEAEILDSYIMLKIENGLPLTANMQVKICDEAMEPIFLLLDTNQQFINAAPIVPYENNGDIYVSDGTTPTLVKLLINHERLLDLKNAKYIIISALMTTPEVNGEQKQMAPKRSDALGVKIYAKIHAKANIDMPVINEPIITK